MNQRLSRSIWEHAFEGVAVIITIITLFTIFADFGQHTGVVAQQLNTAQMQYLGFMSSGLAFANLLSEKFFGFRLVH